MYGTVLQLRRLRGERHRSNCATVVLGDREKLPAAKDPADHGRVSFDLKKGDSDKVLDSSLQQTYHFGGSGTASRLTQSIPMK